MNERFLSKAKDVRSGRWITGHYVYHINRTLCAIGDSLKDEDQEHLIMCDSFSDWNMPTHVEAYKIDPSTLCQCTGLKDKNGVLMFDGDKVKVFNTDEDEIEVITEIIWGDDYPAFELKDTFFDDCNNISLIMAQGYTIEVIGNIHDKEGDLMKYDINRLIELEQSKLPKRIDKCTLEANSINIDMTINDHTDVDEIELMIKFAARVRKIKEFRGRW